MHQVINKFHNARLPVVHKKKLWTWARQNLWNTPINAFITVVLLYFLAQCAPTLIEWSLTKAVFTSDADICQAARGLGACWGVVAEKYRLILFGRYPYDEQWRPLIATVSLVILLIASCTPFCWRKSLIAAWALVWTLFFGMMRGGNYLGIETGLILVSTDQWGGLPLTLMLATLSIAMAFPLSIAVALGRQSSWPVLRSLFIVYVEVIRGVPLISLLFMASFMFPLLVPTGTSPDVLIRVLAAITLFSSAYMAEIVRGGLQMIPKGQVQAAQALGLNYWQTQRYVVLPQALVHVLPGLMNNFIAIFKDTSLITIVSLYELTGSLSLAISGDANWRPFKIEGYLFITLIYFVICFAMSRYSLWVERQVTQL